MKAMVAGGQFEPAKMFTDRFGFDDFPHAYDVFTDAASTHALKVLVGKQ
jgi:alcohol dehydrogenase